MLRALWQPRLMEAIGWIAEEVAADAQAGRHVISVEQRGRTQIAGVILNGTFDRLDRLADGRLGIVDYKTGKAPSLAAVREGYNMQLGLLGLIAEQAGFDGISGTVAAFEYWSLAKHNGRFGHRTSPVDPEGAGGRIVTADFTQIAAGQFIEAATRWLTGEEPFTAKLVPEYAPYTDYDQLMRLGEWYGR